MLFGRVGRVASEATLELVTKTVCQFCCMAWKRILTNVNSLDFIFTRFCMKLFNTIATM